MINFSLICKKNHEFEGWFRTSEDYESQIKQGLISCPFCNDTSISKALMAPAVRSSKKKHVEKLPSHKNETNNKIENKSLIKDDNIRVALRNFRSYIEKNCEDVGDNFAKDARLISKGESKERSIYGKVNNEDAEKLLDEGIEINAIPWIKDDA